MGGSESQLHRSWRAAVWARILYLRKSNQPIDTLRVIPCSLWSHQSQGYQTPLIMSLFVPLLISLFFFSSSAVAWTYTPSPDCSTTLTPSEFFSSSIAPSTGSTTYPPSSSQAPVLSTSTTASPSNIVGGSSNSTTTSARGPVGFSAGGHSSHKGAIAGGVIAGIAAIGVAALALFWYCRRRRAMAPYAPSTDHREAGEHNPSRPMLGQETSSLPGTSTLLTRLLVRPHVPDLQVVLMYFSTHRTQEETP